MTGQGRKARNGGVGSMAEFFCATCRKSKPVQGRHARLNKAGKLTRYVCADCHAKRGFVAKVGNGKQ